MPRVSTPSSSTRGMPVAPPEGRWHSVRHTHGLVRRALKQRARPGELADYPLRLNRPRQGRGPPRDRLESEIHVFAATSTHAPVIQALQALRGVQEVAAATLVAEVGECSRFRHPAQIIAYAGLVPREYSSGASRWQGRHYQDRQLTFAMDHRRIRMGLSLQAIPQGGSSPAVREANRPR